MPDEGDYYLAWGPYYYMGNYSSRSNAVKALRVVRNYESKGMTPEVIYPLIGLDEGFEAEDFPGFERFDTLEAIRKVPDGEDIGAWLKAHPPEGFNAN